MATNENSNQKNQSNSKQRNNQNRNKNRNNKNNNPKANSNNSTENKPKQNNNLKSNNSNPNNKKRTNRNWRRKPRRKKTNENNKNSKTTSSDLLPPKKGENKKKGNHNKIVNVGRALNDITKKLQNDIKSIKDNTKVCGVCNKKIEDMLTAIKIGDDLFCHFQCAQNKILEKEKLKNNETLTYIGNGDFSVIQKRNNRGKNYLFMRKRITRDEQEF